MFPKWACFLILVAFVFCLVDAQKSGISTNDDHAAGLKELDESNWRTMLNGEWMVEFYAPWCPACKNLSPTWEKYALAASSSNVGVAHIDVTTSPSLSGRFFVTALPTIYHVKEGEFRQYRGPRDLDSLIQFLKLKQWKTLEPLSMWKNPDTVHMSIVSYFFKLSHTLKDFNAQLQVDYGLPAWGSYALFALSTIFVGAALGLALVCLVDFLYPPKKTPRQSFSEAKATAERADIEDIANDEIEDDDEERDDDDDEEDDDDDEDESVENDEADGGKDSGSTSEAEKISNVDDAEEEEDDSELVASSNVNNKKSKQQQQEEEKEQQNQQQQQENTKSSPIEVRKRKPRKAD